MRVNAASKVKHAFSRSANHGEQLYHWHSWNTPSRDMGQTGCPQPDGWPPSLCCVSFPEALKSLKHAYLCRLVIAENKNAQVVLPMHGDYLTLDIQIPIGLIQSIELLDPSSAQRFSYFFCKESELPGIVGDTELEI